jgi:rhamnosyltransferase subunit B
MPLRILLASIGSMGDVHPVLALGKELRRRGHGVALATSGYFREAVEAEGIEFVELGMKADFEALMSDPRLWSPLRGMGAILELAVNPCIERLYRIIEARGSGTVVAATTLCLGARVAQDRLGVPTATLHLQPGSFVSELDGGQVGPLDLGPGKPRILKRALYAASELVLATRLVAPVLNPLRARLGLGPARRIFRSYMHSPQLVIGLFPEWFAAPQADWPANSHLTGFLMHDGRGAASALAEADEFLACGPPPVLVTPGSAAMDRDRFFRHAIAACAAEGARAMLVTHFPRQLPRRLPDGIRAFPYLPFSSVMPRCSAVAHHGGIGTVAQSFRAGVPQLIVPNAYDQPDNGARVESLGAGAWVGPISARTGGIRRALGRVLGSAAMRGRAAALAPGINPSEAASRAADLVESLGPPQGLRPSSTS